jgi:Peptidase family M28
MKLLTCLLFGVLAQSEPAPEVRQLLGIRGPLVLGQEQVLASSVDFYGNFGRLAVAEGTDAERLKLIELGFQVEPLGPWPGRARLVVMGAGQETDFASFPLYAVDGQELRAVPLAEALRHGHQLGGCHAHSIAPVLRRAALPTRFQAPLLGIGPAPAAAASQLSSAAAPALGGSGPLSPQAAVLPDPRIAALLPGVSAANIQATVVQLSSYTTRRSTSPQLLQAQTWLKAQLAAIPGLVVSEHLWDSGHAPNIVAELTGMEPDQVLVLGAHLDSINLSGSTLPAPGADDNASGSAGLLEAARVMAAGDFEHSVRFVWFSGEEFGLLGADAYAQQILADGDQPLAMLNMDMIAHRASGDPLDLDLVTNNTNAELTEFIRSATLAYVPDLPVVFGTLTAGSSDHAAFQANGIPAAFLFEDTNAFSQVIHTSNDTISSASANDFILAQRITRACVASAAEIAEPIDLEIQHVALTDSTDASGPYKLSSQVTSLTPATVAAVEVYWRVNAGAWQSRDLRRNLAGQWVGSLPASGPNAEFEYYLLATDSAGYREWLPEGYGPGSAVFGFSVGTFTTAFSDDFETPTDNGWTHVQVATQDDWQRGTPAGKGNDAPSAFSGTRAWGNDLGPSGFNGLYQPNVSNRLESPAINLTGKDNVHLRYRRWLTVEDGQFDRATIRVDGNIVWQNPIGGGSDHLLDSTWQLHALNVSALADNDPSLRLRFELQSDGGLEFGGWNVDDVQLVEVGPGLEKNFAADQAHLSSGSGSLVQLSLKGGPAQAGKLYLIAGSLSGTTPGTPFGSALIPLNADSVTTALLGQVNTALAPNWLGQLSALGSATAGLALPALNPALVGSKLYLAWFTLNPTQFASVPLELEFVY